VVSSVRPSTTVIAILRQCVENPGLKKRIPNTPDLIQQYQRFSVLVVVPR
jgi:hypothetical protein